MHPSNPDTGIEAVRLYLSGLGTPEIAQKLNIAQTTARDYLLYHRIPFRAPNELTKCFMREDFFSVIDTEEKAYFLGWLYSDGNVSKNLKTISLTVLSKDIDIIERLNNLVYDEPRHYIYRKYVKLLMSRKRMSRDLVRLGCVPNKTLVLKFPTYDQVPATLVHHFLRGYSDGDGSFYDVMDKNKDKRLCCKIASTRIFCEEVGKIAKGFNPLITYRLEDINDIGSGCVAFSGFNAMRFGHYLYRDSTIHLNRKRDRWLKGLMRQRDKVYPSAQSWMRDKADDVYDLIEHYATKDNLLTQN